jgi:hypothetical protein
MSFRAKAKITCQLWDIQHPVPTGTLPKGTIVQVLRKAPKADHIAVLHEGVVHSVFKHHLELVQD